MKIAKIFLVATLLFSLSNIDFVLAKNWEWMFDQTKVYPECIRIQKPILKEFWNTLWLTPEQWCSLYMMWYEWRGWKFQDIAYSSYAKVISTKNWVLRIQYKDRYGISTVQDITIGEYKIPKNFNGKTLVINLMYNNDIDIWDYFIDNEVPYIVNSVKFISVDLKLPNTYCTKTYWKWYKYDLVSHSCKK